MGFPSVRDLRRSRNREVLQLLEERVRNSLLQAQAERRGAELGAGAVSVLMSTAAREALQQAAQSGEPFDRQAFVDLARDMADWAQDHFATDGDKARSQRVSA